MLTNLFGILGIAMLGTFIVLIAILSGFVLAEFILERMDR
jgi:hypothetical protein